MDREKDRDKAEGEPGQPERRQCVGLGFRVICGRWVALTGASWDQHQRSVFHQAARLRKAGFSRNLPSRRPKLLGTTSGSPFTAMGCLCSVRGGSGKDARVSNRILA